MEEAGEDDGTNHKVVPGGDAGSWARNALSAAAHPVRAATACSWWAVPGLDPAKIAWLALLLIRVTETTCQATWPGLRRELDRIALGTVTGPAGTFRQRTELTKDQRDIFAQLTIDPPPRIFQLTTETP